MKKLNLSYKSKMKYFTAVLGVLTVFTFVACGGSGGGGGSVAPVNTCCGIYGGPGLTNATLLETVMTSTYDGVVLNLGLFGQVAGNYGGPAGLQGTMVINNPGNASFCSAPPGTYNVTTVQAGTVFGTYALSPMILQASGPANILINVTSGTINYNGVSTLSLSTWNNTINGMVCPGGLLTK